MSLITSPELFRAVMADSKREHGKGVHLQKAMFFWEGFRNVAVQRFVSNTGFLHVMFNRIISNDKILVSVNTITRDKKLTFIEKLHHRHMAACHLCLAKGRLVDHDDF